LTATSWLALGTVIGKPVNVASFGDKGEADSVVAALYK